MVLATGCNRGEASAGSPPARSWKFAPVIAPSMICADVIVTGLPYVQQQAGGRFQVPEGGGRVPLCVPRCRGAAVYSEPRKFRVVAVTFPQGAERG